MTAEAPTQTSDPQAPPANGKDKALEKIKPGDKATAMDFRSGENFALLQRVAKSFSESTLVPAHYQGKVANCMIALNMAQRMNADPLMVMQNLYLVHGNPGWSSKFLIATANQCGKFSALRYEWKGEPGSDDRACRAWAIEKATGERLDGVWITWQMATAEGWVNKNGSKWRTMPDQMFVYRAAAFWVRAYAPELAMGLPTAEEVRDMIDLTPGAGGVYELQEDDNGQPESLADRLTTPREGAIQPEPEPPNDGGMAEEDALRDEVQALYVKCINTKGKARMAESKLKTAFSVATVQEIPSDKLGKAVDLFKSLLEE